MRVLINRKKPIETSICQADKCVKPLKEDIIIYGNKK